MSEQVQSNGKIINDPVYGFIDIRPGIIYDLVEHPYFQRLRRIKQLGLTNYVYPGTMHTRFQHALGAMYLMGLAIDVLRSKGHNISDEESTAVMIAILLHDIGHGPFSHTLEHSLVTGISHEDLSIILMECLNKEFSGQLTLAIEIFLDNYPKHFLHQLVSSQLDMDRLDYLRRDSFFSGVSEGVVGSDRIIKMLEVSDDKLVVESKGIYSIEKFLIARRLMYWQVYLHKTVIASEQMLVNILLRAKELAGKNEDLFATPALRYFLYNNINKEYFKAGSDKLTESISCFTQLDDYDIITSIKIWATHHDKALSVLCYRLLNRKLFKIRISNRPFSSEEINSFRKKAENSMGLTTEQAQYFAGSDSISNFAYDPGDYHINILYKSGEVTDISKASDMLNTETLSKTVTKYFLYFTI
ncbi:MAG: HD domain-containing protein [Bacteroidia bacterium]|nr:HD domain-containing protein [Bacteroidia bacterium]